MVLLQEKPATLVVFFLHQPALHHRPLYHEIFLDVCSQISHTSQFLLHDKIKKVCIVSLSHHFSFHASCHVHAEVLEAKALVLLVCMCGWMEWFGMKYVTGTTTLLLLLLPTTVTTMTTTVPHQISWIFSLIAVNNYYHHFMATIQDNLP